MSTFAIITWDNAAQKAAGMSALSARVGSAHVLDWAADVAEDGAEQVKDTIQSGGVISTKKGGPRIKSGQMIGTVAPKTELFGDGSALAHAGWPNGGPDHTIWQEKGTSRGIPPMMSLEMSKIRMSMALPVRGVDMLTRIKGEWNAI